jgi:RNA polymerase sigma factor (sigma-70 family)
MPKILQLFNQETQLVRALLRNEEHAQRHLYEKYAAKMLGICVRYVVDTMAAEDVLMEAFMKVFGKIEQYKGEGSLEAWIRRIVVNEALGYLRLSQKMEMVDLDEVKLHPNYLMADKHLEEEELLGMIRKLPDGYRAVFNLYAIEGYSHNEIAAMLGISESTSKSQLHRARAALQRLLSDWYETYQGNNDYGKTSD